MKANRILLYDCERDKNLEVGEAILVFEDGSTRRVRESSLYEKEVANVRQPAEVQRPSLFRIRSTEDPKRRAKYIKQTPARKRHALYKA